MRSNRPRQDPRWRSPHRPLRSVNRCRASVDGYVSHICRRSTLKSSVIRHPSAAPKRALATHADGRHREVLPKTAAKGRAASEDWRVAESVKLDDEAERLMLARMVAAPEAWRARATAAGGFLGAAAVVAFWGLTNNASSLGSGGAVVAGVASLLYVLAVLLFLAASVWPSRKSDSDTTTDFFMSTKEYVDNEVKPIKCLVILGAIMAGCALASTAVCSYILLSAGRDVAVMISMQEPTDRATLERLCPGISDPFQGVISSESKGNILDVKINSPACGAAGATLTLPRADITVLEKSGK